MASPSRRRVCITGIDGFTGRHLTKALRSHGWEVAGIGDSPTSPTPLCLTADLAETDKIAEWLASVRPSHLIHLAARSHVVGDNEAFYRVNVLGTESLLESVLRSNISTEKILIASSANVYGNAERSPISESCALAPTNHYALSKVAMEILTRRWFERLPIVVTRPFNYTGLGQSEAFLLPKVVGAHARRAPTLRLGNLHVARDIGSVAYVCEVYKRLLTSPCTSEVLNVCSGTSTTLLAVLEMMAQLASFSPKIEVDPKLVRANEVIQLVGDPTRLYEQIGYVAPVPILTILEDMYHHARQQVIASN